MLIDDVIAGNLVPSRDDLATLPAFDFTDVCEVVVSAEDPDDCRVLDVRQCINCCPPFEEFWMESAKFPVDVGQSGERITVKRWGCLVLRFSEATAWGYQMRPFVRYFSGVVKMLPPVLIIAMTEHWDGVGSMAVNEEGEELGDPAAGITDVFAIPILRALTFLACSNADVREVRHADGMQRKRAKRGLQPLVSYSRIMVPGGSHSEGEPGTGSHKPLHRVRGHFCRRRKEDWGKPGAVWWKRSHVRGDATLGIRVGRYALSSTPLPGASKDTR